MISARDLRSYTVACAAAVRQVGRVLLMVVEEDLHMRRAIALILVAAMASGCVATHHSPPETVVSGLRAIAVVPIEAPRVRQINPQVIDYMQFTHAKLALQRVGGGRRQAYRLEEFLLFRCHGR